MGESMFEWDENKRLQNLAKHQLDFAEGYVVFESFHVFGQVRTVDGELRQLVTGRFEDLYVTIVFTIRDGSTRLISMRRARREEREHYETIYRR